MQKLYWFVIILLLIGLTQAQEEQEEEQQYFKDYADHMGGFVADQTFTIHIPQYNYEDFMIPVNNEADSIRGLFFVETSEDRQLLFWMEQAGVSLANHLNKRMVIFKANVTPNRNIRVVMKNIAAQKKVYFSYQIVKRKAADQKVYALNEDFLPVLHTYKEIAEEVERIAFSIQTAKKASIGNTQSVMGQRMVAFYWAMIETAVILIATTASLVLLKKTLQKGYTSIV